MTDAYDAHGAAVLDCFRGSADAPLICHHDGARDYVPATFWLSSGCVRPSTRSRHWPSTCVVDVCSMSALAQVYMRSPCNTAGLLSPPSTSHPTASQSCVSVAIAMHRQRTFMPSQVVHSIQSSICATGSTKLATSTICQIFLIECANCLRPMDNSSPTHSTCESVPVLLVWQRSQASGGPLLWRNGSALRVQRTPRRTVLRFSGRLCDAR